MAENQQTMAQRLAQRRGETNIISPFSFEDNLPNHAQILQTHTDRINRLWQDDDDSGVLEECNLALGYIDAILAQDADGDLASLREQREKLVDLKTALEDLLADTENQASEESPFATNVS